MKFRPVNVDDLLQELTEHGTDEYPLSMDRQIVECGRCGIIRHWHYEIQIVLVTSGIVKFLTPHSEYVIRTGEGIFINSKCLHEAVSVAETASEYICVNFHPRLIYGDSSSLIRRDYVAPVLKSAEMQTIPLRSEEWHQRICSLLQEMAEVCVVQEYGYEIEMKIILQKMWHILLVNNRPLIEESSHVTFTDKQRLKNIQKFIHKNYSESISLLDLAQCVHISKEECCRLFKRVLQTTPFTFLINYRLAKSTELLTSSELSVAEIAQNTGFGSSSYYTERFKKVMHCTPVEYRRNKKTPREKE